MYVYIPITSSQCKLLFHIELQSRSQFEHITKSCKCINFISIYLKHLLDLQCSTEDEDDEFQEVSEDENSAANILDQGERMHSMSNAGGSEEGGSDLLDANNMKSEMKIEPPQLAGGK